ncbi:MAG TPA: uracil-DNA glycosylase [Woeseiaceae bacterium]|nr:uracil-DNA glycosylase [Woeseiaceae bacterium]
MQLDEQQRRAYLDALGITLWLPREQRDDAVNSDAATVEIVQQQSPAQPVSSLGWDGLRDCVADCRLCELHKGRTQTVFGVGDQDASWMIIGEAPGAEEDRRGEPFVGRAGALLDEMLRAAGFERKNVYIANTVKCRPPGNRNPRSEESAACRAYLDRQIELVSPDLILAVGKVAAQNLLGSDEPVGALRGQRHMFGRIPLIVTYHPAYLLRSPTQKRLVWQDLCLAKMTVAEAGR